MNKLWRGWLVLVPLIALAGVGAYLTIERASVGQDLRDDGVRIPRTASGKPNLNGVWQAVNTANHDLLVHSARPGLPQLGAVGATPAGLGVVENNEIPYQPWAAAQQKKNFERRFTDDPELKCYLPGVPRATYLPYPFQFFQNDEVILVSYEYASASRLIFMNRKRESPAPSWMGESSGRWEGDTLVVDVVGFNDKTWFDRAGNFHSDALHVVERFTPIGRDALRYDVTVDDPKVFTRPWKMSMPLYRRLEEDAQLLEFKCVEFAEDLVYGHLYGKRRTP